MMRTAAVVLSLTLGTMWAAANAAAESPAPSSRQVPPSELTHFFKDYFAAVEAGDPDGILALVDADFVIKWPGGPPFTEREPLRAALAKMEQSFQQKVEWEVVEGRIAGEWAWVRVNEKATHIPKNGGEARVLEGSHLTILRKVGGRWLMHREHGSLNQLPERPKK